MSQKQPKRNKSTSHGRYFASQNNRMRKKMLYLGYQMGYDIARNEAQKDLPAHEVNKQNVSGWCESEKCSIRKPLEAMTGKELRAAISQFEKVYQSFLRKYAG